MPPQGSVDSTVGQSYIVNFFMAVVLGGVGNKAGTALGDRAEDLQRLEAAVRGIIGI